MGQRMTEDEEEQLRDALVEHGGGHIIRVDTRDDGRTAVMVRTVRRSIIIVIVLEVRR